MNGRLSNGVDAKDINAQLNALNKQLALPTDNSEFHGDKLLADKIVEQTGFLADLWKVVVPKNVPELFKVAGEVVKRKSPDVCLPLVFLAARR